MLQTATFTLTAPTLVFSGKGRVRLAPGGTVRIAPTASDVASTATSVAVPGAGLTLEFFEDTDVYATGSGSPSLEVLATDAPKSVGLSIDCGC